jgi:hypothetical protein
MLPSIQHLGFDMIGLDILILYVSSQQISSN